MMTGKDSFIRRFFLKSSVRTLPLAVGILAVAITMQLLGVFTTPPYLVPCLSVALGAMLWYAAVILGDRKRFYFAATFLILTGALLLLIDSGNVYLSLSSVWPFLMLFISAAFIVSGYLHYKKLHPLYMAPALVFAGLGFIFLLFATNVIAFSLTTVVLWWFPILLLPPFIACVVWLAQKMTHKPQ